MAQDAREKRAQFIDTSVKIRECFHFAHPAEQILAVEKYCTSAYGSNLWDLGSPEAKMFVNAWRTGHKLAWEVPRSCHTYLVQEVLAPHVVNLNASLLLKFVGFFQEPYCQSQQRGGGACPLGGKGHQEQLGQEPGPGQGSQWWA